MEWRFVSGRANRRFHVLDAGTLTLSGKLWAYEKRRAGAAQPQAVKIEVLKDDGNDGQDDEDRTAFCSAIVTPSAVLNERKEFSTSCGRVESGKYWIRISKPTAQSHDGDGWHNQGHGTLSTQ
jgi:hypothetical protein